MKKNAILGIVFIVLAIYLVLNNFNMVPDLPIVKLAISAALVAVGIEGAKKRDFIAITVPLAIIGCLFDEELNIESLTPWTILVVAVLLGLGLQLIFKKKPIVMVNVENGMEKLEEYTDTVIFDGDSSEGGKFHVENGFGSSSQYVNVQNMVKGHVENSFGNLNIYFNGSTVSEEGANIHVDNGMGNINMYFPSNFRVSLSQDSGLGRVTQYGQPAFDESLPVVKVFVENGMGNVNIYFN